jgi:Flp pilus assembly pilin Flp
LTVIEIIRKKLSLYAQTFISRGRHGQTAIEYALLLVGVALITFASFSSMMARTASTTDSVSRQVAAANSTQGASGGGVSVEWGSH